jgi:hypothetical protein
MTVLSEQLRRHGIEIQELQGAALAGEIPLPVALVNRLAAQRIAAMSGPIGGLTLAARDGQQFTATVALRGQSLIPPLTFALRVVQQPDLPGRPTLVLRWSMPALGILARVAAPALTFFKTLPRGIRMDGELLTVDLAELLRAQGSEEILAHLTRLEVLTREGAFVVRFDARIGTPS